MSEPKKRISVDFPQDVIAGMDAVLPSIASGELRRTGYIRRAVREQISRDQEEAK